MEDFPGGTVAMFEPISDLQYGKGVTIEEAATLPDDQHCVTLIIHNNSLEPVNPDEGEIFGNL